MAAVLMLSCTGQLVGDTEQARVSLAIVTADSVARVSVTIGPGGGPAFVAIQLELSRAGSQWTGYVTGVPAGPARSIEATAYDGAGQELYRGATQTDVQIGETAFAFVLLEQVHAAGYANAVPVIDLAWMSAVTVAAGGSAQLGITAHDPDGGSLAYQWTADCGTFDATTQPVVTWAAPASGSGCGLTVAVSDPLGAVVTLSTRIEVN
jgi:hypothetical protein